MLDKPKCVWCPDDSKQCANNNGCKWLPINCSVKDKRREVRVFHMRKEDLNSVCQKLGIKHHLRSFIFVKCVFQNQQKVLAYVCKLRRLYFLTWPWKWGIVKNCTRGYLLVCFIENLNQNWRILTQRDFEHICISICIILKRVYHKTN